MLKKLLRLLGSVNLALLLLAVLIVASVIGTLCEKSFSTEVAQAYVYGSWWFTFWLLLLTVNLICAAAVRFPWQRYQYAFVVTHAGIVLILFGGMIDRHWGVEGNVRLTEGNPPVNRMSIAGEELVVEVNGASSAARTPFPMALLKQRMSVSLRAASPAEEVRVEIVDVKPVEPNIGNVEPTEGRSPALKWRLKSSMMGDKSGWLFVGTGTEAYPGMVAVRFVHDEPTPQTRPATISFFFDKSEQLSYQRSSSAGVATGPVEVGKEVALPWGHDSVFVVEKFLPSGRPRVVWSVSNDEEAQPGVRCRVDAGGESALVWIGPRMAPPVTPWQEVRVGGKTVRLSFDQRTQELPFGLQLVKFNAPEHEGQAGHYVLFESVLRFNGQNGTEQTASMNNPATYPHTWYGPPIGTSYRISQASHEPGRKDVSIVQVLRDPGWLPKWFGSLMVCVGIFWTFYLRRPPASRAETPAKNEAS